MSTKWTNLFFRFIFLCDGDQSAEIHFIGKMRTISQKIANLRFHETYRAFILVDIFFPRIRLSRLNYAIGTSEFQTFKRKKGKNLSTINDDIKNSPPDVKSHCR